MKKKLLAVLLAMSMVMTFCACSSDNEESATTENAENKEKTSGALSTKDYNPDDYVTLGEYEGLEVTVDVMTFTDADVEEQLQAEVEYYVESADLYKYTVTDKTVVEEGDIVNIDYVGKKEGVAFDGGTASGHHLEIGSGAFIEGFEEGLIGKNVGETVVLNLTFPEEYHSEELAGAAVTFDVTINSIDTREMPELTDQLVVDMNIELSTVQELRDTVKNYIQESCDDENQTERETVVWDTVYATCTVSEVPQELIDDVYTQITDNAEMYAGYYGVNVEEFITNYMGMTMEEYEAESKASALETVKEKMTIAAIAKKAGISLSDEDVQAAAEAEYEEYGYETAQQLLDDIGIGAYYDYVLSQKVYEYLQTCVTIKENEPVSMFAEDEIEIDGEDIEAEEIEIEE